MKVGILTFQFADNYGAVLQCLALQEACKKYGADANVIDYLPSKMVSKKSRIKKMLLPKGFEKKFEQFRNVHFQRMSIKEACDVILVGSDQVWNSDINEYDDFWICPEMKFQRLCSYAASFGKNQLTEKEENYLLNHKKEFEKYFSITVRENAGKKFLEKLQLNAETVCDPTMLFYNHAALFENLAEKSGYKTEGEYVLVYSLEHSDKLDEMIQKVKKETGKKVIALHPMNAQLQLCDEFAADASVYDFLALIKNADYVLTNSFHGLAFSYIFRKKVYCFHHSSLSSRQSELIARSEFQVETISDGTYYIDGTQKTKALDNFVAYSEEKLRTMITA